VLKILTTDISVVITGTYDMAGQILDDIAATRWHNLKVKCTKFDFDWAPPQTPLGSLQLSPDLLPGVKGPTSKGRGGQRREGMGMGK